MRNVEGKALPHKARLHHSVKNVQNEILIKSFWRDIFYLVHFKSVPLFDSQKKQTPRIFGYSRTLLLNLD